LSYVPEGAAEPSRGKPLPLRGRRDPGIIGRPFRLDW